MNQDVPRPRALCRIREGTQQYQRSNSIHCPPRLPQSFSHQTLSNKPPSSIVREGISRRPSFLPARFQLAPVGKVRFGHGPTPPPLRCPPLEEALFCSFICRLPPPPASSSSAQGPLRLQSLGRAGSNLQVSPFTSKKAAHRIYISEKARDEPSTSHVRGLTFVFPFPPSSRLCVPGGSSHPREPSST